MSWLLLVAALPPAAMLAWGIADELSTPEPLPPRADAEALLERMAVGARRKHIEACCGPPGLDGLYDTAGLADYRAPLWFRLLDGWPGISATVAVLVALVVFRAEPAVAWPLLGLVWGEFLLWVVIGGIAAVRHRRELEAVWAVPFVPLGTPVADLEAAFGEPHERSSHDDIEGAEWVTFALAMPHDLVVADLQGHVVQCTVWSSGRFANEDLACVAGRYRGDSSWDVLTEGYLYRRADGELRLWCSAVPAIGVGFTDPQAAATRLAQSAEMGGG